MKIMTVNVINEEKSEHYYFNVENFSWFKEEMSEKFGDRLLTFLTICIRNKDLILKGFCEYRDLQILKTALECTTIDDDKKYLRDIGIDIYTSLDFLKLIIIRSINNPSKPVNFVFPDEQITNT